MSELAIRVENLSKRYRIGKTRQRHDTLRPGPLWTFLKSMNSWQAVRSAVNAGWQALGWMR